MPGKRRLRRVQPSMLSYNGIIAVTTISLMLQSCHVHKPSLFAEAFGLPLDPTSTEFLTLLTPPAEAWLIPLVAPPLSSLLSSTSNTHNSWSSLALPADLSFVCDQNDECQVTSKKEETRERPMIEVLFGSITRANTKSSTFSTSAAETQGSRIHLTAEEQELFQLLVDFRDECCPRTTIRVAGGWVRDKLLAYQKNAERGGSDGTQQDQRTLISPPQCSSKDIDLVTSNISGQAFAHLLRGYLTKRKLSSSLFASIRNPFADDLEFSFPQLTYSKAEGILEGASTAFSLDSDSANGESKSNPLQTANFKIGAFDIDVCHLRKDQYDVSSRVPTQTQLASPAEDSWRRDLTINALFYNLHSNQIEDWTEQGLEDLLTHRRIATPKAPLPTLLQDPLRILRAIRFAAQFSFTMDPKLIKAARNPQVQAAVNAKLSQCRRAKEMDAIFRTSNPALGIGFLLDTDLLSALLPTPKASKTNGGQTDESWEKGFLVLLYTQRLASQVFVKSGDWKEVNRRFLWYAALLQPFYYQQLQESVRSKSPLFDLLNSKLKISKSDVQSIESIIKGLDIVPTLLNLERNVPEYMSEFETKYETQQAERLTYYEALLQVGPLWKEALLLHLAVGCQKRDGSMSVEKAIHEFQKLQSKIRNLRLESDGSGNYDNIFGLHPLLTGSELMNEENLPRLPQGKSFKEVMEEQKRWQICHLDAVTSPSSKEAMVLELREHLRKSFPDYA